jgi:hypothetical protein
MTENIFSVLTPLQIGLIIFLALFDLIFKAIGLWHSAKNEQKTWFIFIFLLNTAGILPLIYLKFFQKK